MRSKGGSAHSVKQDASQSASHNGLCGSEYKPPAQDKQQQKIRPDCDEAPTREVNRDLHKEKEY